MLSFIACHQSSTASKEDLDKITRIFRQMDTKKDGHLERDQISKVFKFESEQELDQVMNALDLDKNGYIDFNEWKSATLINTD